MATAAAQRIQRGGARRLWRVWAYLYIALSIVSMLMYAQTAFLAPSTYGGAASASLGADLIRTTETGRIDVLVRGLKPGSPLAHAGVHEGDRLRLDIRWNDFRTLAAGEVFGFTRVAPGKPEHLAFVVPVYEGHAKNVGNYRFLITLFDLGVGLLLFVRLRGDIGAEALGMAFVAATITSNFPSPPGWSIFWITVAYSGVALTPFLMLAFAMSFYDRHTRRLKNWEKTAYGILVFSFVPGMANVFFSNYFAYTAPPIRVGTALLFLEVVLAYAATVAYLARGYAASIGSIRARYGLLLIALLLTFCLTAVQTYSFFVLKLARMDPENPLYDVNVVLSLAGPLLFAYAVLRHRVIDLGFVLNRTLIYGVISIVMLSAFGLIEWAVGHVLQPSGRNESAVLDATIAVLVSLSFSRVHDIVERNVEALFFRSWHENEKRLQRFMAEAAFITRPENLKAAFVQEVARFAGGASVALYLEDGATRYVGFGSPAPFPAAIDTDDAVPVAMRAQRAAIYPADTASALAAALALPMLHRNALLGFVLLGSKPGGEVYRPDEVEVLCHAAHQVGHDLHALAIDQLERERAQLIQTVRRLEYENAMHRGDFEVERGAPPAGLELA
jgi:hypothetical protein